MEGGSPSARAGLVSRALNVLLGCWLFASVFLWPHNGAEGFNAMITGVLVAGIAPLAVWVPEFRFGNAYLAVWLLVTTLFFRHETPVTLLDDALVALAILALALVPGRPRPLHEARASA